MTGKEAIELLRRHNEWRRGAEIEMESPEKLGKAIEAVCARVEYLEGMIVRLNQSWDGKRKKEQGSPNHGHEIPGIWDRDNGAKAGKPCAECALYDEARAIARGEA